MGSQLTIASSLPTFRLRAEPLVALNVVEANVAQFLRNRVTLFRLVLRHKDVARPTNARSKRDGGVVGITNGMRWTFAVALAYARGP